jgi:O-antigen/teichoic acid export membrane protein
MKKLIGALQGNTFLKSSAIMFAGTMLANVVSYLYHVIVGRILGPVQYGELAALISIFYILNAPSTVLQNIVVKFFSSLKATNDTGQAKKLLTTITKYVLVAGLLGLLMLLPFVSSISHFLHISNTLYIIWLYLIFATFLLGIINASVLQGYQKFFETTAVANVTNIFRLVFSIIGAYFGVGWTLIANIFSNSLGYVGAFLPLKSILKAREKPLTISAKSALLYSVPTLITMLSVVALYSQDVILVKHFFTSAEAGLYSALSVLGKIVFFASSSIGLVAFPTLAERAELKKPIGNIVLLSVGSVTLISLGITTVYFMFPDIIVGMLYGKAFEGASVYLGWFGLFIAFFSLSNLLATMYLALGKTGVWALSLIAAISQTVLIYMNHNSLQTVITSNIIVCAGLFAGLLLYYPYATRKS